MLAIDPASKKTGYAVLESLEPAGLLEAGLLVPSSSKRVCAGSAEAGLADVAAWFAAGELAACRRVVELLEDVRGLVEAVEPGRVVIEVPSGKVGTGARRGASGSLTTYGMAAGAVWACCRALGTGGLKPGPPGYGVVPVTERMWTKDAGSKAERAALAASVYRGRYRVADDGGQDVADAIGLGRWWLRRVMGGAG